MTIQVNIWAILVASVANLIIGALWYSPLVLGGRWSKLSRIRLDEAHGTDQFVMYAGLYFSGLVLSAILAVVISISGIVTIWEALILGAMVWLGFTAAPAFATTILEGRSFELWGINAGHPFAATLVMSMILVSWR